MANTNKEEIVRYREALEHLKISSQKILDDLIVKIALLAFPFSVVSKNIVIGNDTTNYSTMLVLLFISFIGVIISHKFSILAADRALNYKTTKADFYNKAVKILNSVNFYSLIVGISLYFFNFLNNI